MSIKYLGMYAGPSRSSYDDEYMDGFTSIKSAVNNFYERCHGPRGSAYVHVYRRNTDGLYVPWESNYYHFFGAEEDVMYLYGAERQDDGAYLRHEEASHRLTIGPRGGVVVERMR